MMAKRLHDENYNSYKFTCPKWMNSKEQQISLVEEKIIGVKEIAEFLRTNKVVFIVENAGSYRWINCDDTFIFWNDAKIRIVEPKEADEGFSIDNYPNGYCYIARLCKSKESDADILFYIILQMFH